MSPDGGSATFTEVSYSKYTVKTQDFSKNEDKDL
jgi:hypothetical protein